MGQDLAYVWNEYNLKLLIRIY